MSTPRRAPSGSFSYRHNLDGTWDSICLHCFMTAASSPLEDELQILEQLHICSPAKVSEATKLTWTLQTLCDLLESPSLSPEVRVKIAEIKHRIELEIAFLLIPRRSCAHPSPLARTRPTMIRKDRLLRSRVSGVC